MSSSKVSKLNISIGYEVEVYNLDGNPNKVVRTLDHEDMPDFVNDIICKEVNRFLLQEQKDIDDYVTGQRGAS